MFVHDLITGSLALVKTTINWTMSVGSGCAGAVSLFAEESGVTGGPGGEKSYRRLTDKQFNELIDELPDRPLLAGEEGIRLSLAGAQSKLPVFYQNGEISLPVGEAASSHILKPPMNLDSAVDRSILVLTCEFIWKILRLTKSPIG
jgi:hypothetical protein